MRFDFVCVTFWALCATSLLAQEKASKANSHSTEVSVPFVGCPSDGQAGPIKAPTGSTKSVAITAKAARGLAYYAAGIGDGVLAPRGWHCFEIYGSGGGALFVIPDPIDTANILSISREYLGPAIEISYSEGGTSGRFDVAEIISRIFPAYEAFVSRVTELFPTSSFPSGPYSRDTLVYKSKSVAEFKTPAHTEGLGTHSGLKKDGSPIYGAAILVGHQIGHQTPDLQLPDLLLLSVRLPPDLTGLTPSIIRQVENDAARPQQ